MQKRNKIFYSYVALLFLVLILAGCMSDTKEISEEEAHSEDSFSKETGHKESDNITKTKENDSLDERSSENSTIDDSNDASRAKEDSRLTEYSSEEIEYARVWLQLGPNQEIDELNIRHISAGEPINPNSDNSANYPEDVIQLSGSRLVDGVVTYHGNGDGTIYVYNVPLRWDSNNQADADKNVMQEVTERIIKEAELVSIELGDEDEIINLISKMNLH